MRQPILYAEAMWRRQWFFGALLVVLGVAIVAVNLFFPAAGRAIGSGSPIWALYVPGGCLMLGALLFYRWRNHVRVREDRLHVSNLLNAVDIPYDLIRGVRVQPLKTAFEAGNRKRYRNPVIRPYEERPALFLRLRRDDPETARIIHKLGARMAWDDMLAIPVPDADALSWEISARLPDKLGTNLGGQRRRAKRRR